MSHNDSDSWGTGPDDWEPPGPGDGQNTEPNGRRAHSGVIMLVATGLAVVIAATLGLGAAFGWFGTSSASSPTNVAETAAPPVDSGDEEDDPEAPVTPLAVPPAEPQPLGDEAESAEAADVAITAVVEATAEIAQRADGDTEGIELITTGFVQGERQAMAEEREQLGYKQIGEATITSVTTREIDLTATPPTVILDVCIDASKIDVVDENGNSLKDRMYNPGGPVLHTYGAQYIDGLWKIATHEIPDSAPCA
ncbi:MAG: hypothetical protein ABWY57_06370 [Mycetocola sp.]